MKAFLAVVCCSALVAAAQGNVEFAGKARFTLLTDRMVRCEWSADGSFEDRPSLTFTTRVLPPVSHTFTRNGEGAVITTDKMRLEWTGGAFTAENLTVNGVSALSEDKENLPVSWQTVWKARDAIAAHPADAKRLLAERAAALQVFIDTDWPRLEKTFDSDFVKRMHMWMERHADS